jgi:hypothetical protein
MPYRWKESRSIKFWRCSSPPRSGIISLYLILIFGLITLFQQPEGSVLTTILLAMVIVGVFVDKIQAFPDHACNFGTLIVRILYFVVPLVTAGITKNPKSRPPAVIMAVLGLGYMFFLWATQMKTRRVSAAGPRDAAAPGLAEPASDLSPG